MMSVPYVWMSTRMVIDCVFFLVSMVGWSCMCIPLRVLGSAAHARTALRTLSLQNHSENPCMRTVRDGASRAGKSRPALLGSHSALIRGFYQ